MVHSDSCWLEKYFFDSSWLFFRMHAHYTEGWQSGLMQQSWKLSWRKSPWVRISVPPPWIIINLRQLRFFCTKYKHFYYGYMKIFILSYVGAFIAMLPLDAFWLYFANSRVYKPRIGHLLASQPDFLAAGIFYLLYILGWVVFVILPALRDSCFSFICFFTRSTVWSRCLCDIWPHEPGSSPRLVLASNRHRPHLGLSPHCYSLFCIFSFYSLFSLICRKFSKYTCRYLV
jgi:hypothetical protein